MNYRAEASFSREKHRKQYMIIMLSMKFAGIRRFELLFKSDYTTPKPF